MHIGIDYGTKKVGLAYSDEAGTLAFPHSVVTNDEHLIEVLETILAERSARTVVIGHSIDNNGEENPVMHDAHALADTLTSKGYMVVLEPEFLTTALADRGTPGTQRDAAAAALILQTYLDKQHT